MLSNIRWVVCVLSTFRKCVCVLTGGVGAELALSDHWNLGGEVLCCEHRLDDLVERFSVGAMNVEGALKYFRKVRSKAVITGGDRPDIQLAALETDTRCLILTGNLYPNDIIISRAEERNVPIILVQRDTLSIVQQVEDIMTRLRIRDKRKIDRAIQLIDEELNFSLLYESLQIEV